MLTSIKALIVVLTVAATIFLLARPIALQFMSEEDFSRRRFVWFALTSVSFVSPNIWLYAIVALPMLLWAARKDSNPIALYVLMLHVIPPIEVNIPMIGTGGLFDLDNYRILSFAVLLPAAISYRKVRKKPAAETVGAMDYFLLGFGVLQVVFYIPPDLPFHVRLPDSPTNALRRAFLFFLDTYLLYYAVSRTCQSRKKMVEVIASFCLACAVMAALGMFERTRNWLLYVEIVKSWGTDPRAGFYMERGGAVRAQTSAGHAIAMGYLLAVALGFWLYLSTRVANRIQRMGTTLLLLLGLYVPFSRGGWLGGASVYLTFNAIGPRAMSRFLRGACLALVAAGLIAISPIGDKIAEYLPKSGQSADLYRDRLAERGWGLVLQHPYFGNQFPWPEMEDLRQGEGIIDMVNSYLGAALNYGFIGLFLFVGFIVIGVLRAYLCVRETSRYDLDLALFGMSLVACIVGTLIMIRTSSFNTGIERTFYLLAGLTTAYVAVVRSPQNVRAQVGARKVLREQR